MKLLLKNFLLKCSEKKRKKRKKIEWLKNIAEKKSLEFKKLSYKELCFFIDEPWVEDYGEGENFYQIEVVVDYDSFKDKEVNKNLRVIVNVDDGGIMSYTGGVNCDFIITPEGEFL